MCADYEGERKTQICIAIDNEIMQSVKVYFARNKNLCICEFCWALTREHQTREDEKERGGGVMLISR